MYSVNICTCHIFMYACRGSFGDMNDEERFYHIEPLNSEDQSVIASNYFSASVIDLFTKVP